MFSKFWDENIDVQNIIMDYVSTNNDLFNFACNNFLRKVLYSRKNFKCNNKIFNGMLEKNNKDIFDMITKKNLILNSINAINLNRNLNINKNDKEHIYKLVDFCHYFLNNEAINTCIKIKIACTLLEIDESLIKKIKIKKFDKEFEFYIDNLLKIKYPKKYNFRKLLGIATFKRIETLKIYDINKINNMAEIMAHLIKENQYKLFDQSFKLIEYYICHCLYDHELINNMINIYNNIDKLIIDIKYIIEKVEHIKQINDEPKIFSYYYLCVTIATNENILKHLSNKKYIPLIEYIFSKCKSIWIPYYFLRNLSYDIYYNSIINFIENNKYNLKTLVFTLPDKKILLEQVFFELTECSIEKKQNNFFSKIIMYNKKYSNINIEKLLKYCLEYNNIEAFYIIFNNKYFHANLNEIFNSNKFNKLIDICIKYKNFIILEYLYNFNYLSDEKDEIIFSNLFADMNIFFKKN
jgi:hypothetical protein